MSTRSWGWATVPARLAMGPACQTRADGQYAPVQIPDPVTRNVMNRWLNLSTQPQSTYIPAPGAAVTFGKVSRESATAAAPPSCVRQ